MVRDPHIDPKSLAALPHQTLVIVGDRDMIRHRHSKLIADSIPNAKFVVLPGSHFIAAEESAEFNRAVEAFLAE